MKILVLSLLFFGALGYNDVVEIDVPGAHNCDDPTYFEVVKGYITLIGDSSTIDISSDMSGHMLTYHFIHEGDWKMTVDNGPRIYFSFKDHQRGNILWEKDPSSVEVKITFEFRCFEVGVDEEEVEREIRALYCALIDRASAYKYEGN
jgi:hypothetical protein